MATVYELASQAIKTLQEAYNATTKYLSHPIYNVMGYSAKGDGIGNDATFITNAVNDATIKGGTISYSPGTYRISTNLTVPSNVTSHFQNGAKLIIDSGVTVTIDGPIEAGAYQIFGGAGTVAGNPKVTKIYARWFGAKLDGVTDDSDALNAFFKWFGKGELVIDNGVALITKAVFSQGLWSKDIGNNGVRKITFDHATIKWGGTPGKAAIHFYNHQSSIIDGLSIATDSVDTFVNFAAVWYSRITNFSITKMTFNKDNGDITALDSLVTQASYTNSFENGYLFESEFYADPVITSAFVNSMNFKNVLLDARSANPYNVKFYGNSFQNFTFSSCDLSYANISCLYIDVPQTSKMRLNFIGCYFDSAIPLIENFDYKGCTINLIDCHEASEGSSQKVLVKTKNFTTMLRMGTFGLEAGSVPYGVLNMVKNGDLLYKGFDLGWFYEDNTTSSGSIGNAAKSIVANANAINGNALQLVYAQSKQYHVFFGMNAPLEGVYSAAIRLKKVSGNGSLQVALNGVYTTYDFANIGDGEEVILCTNAKGKMLTQGTPLNVTLSCIALVANLTVQILEITVVPGANMGYNLQIHPGAVVYPSSGTTSTRPAAYKVGQSYFDTTINKPIWCKTVSPAVWVDSTGATV